MSGWHIHFDGQQNGPHDLAAIRAWYRAGQLPPSTLAWRPGATEWQPLGAMLEAETVPESGPPPVPSPGGQVAPAMGPAFTARGAPSSISVERRTDSGTLARRLGGFVLDAIVFYVGMFILFVVGELLWWALGDSPLATAAVLITNLGGLVVFIVWPILSLGRLGQSYGKHLAGVQVLARDTGRPIGGGNAILRGIVQSIGLWVLGLGWLWALWDPAQQTWHDKAVGSVVVETPGQKRVDPLTHLRAALRGYW